MRGQTVAKPKTSNRSCARKLNSTNKGAKIDFSIEFQQDYTQFTEVTVIPPSFD
jgi:hypothetical protein